ncbi:hypothetical protein GCM10022221_68630 [Actinocorallia aurea]
MGNTRLGIPYPDAGTPFVGADVTVRNLAERVDAVAGFRALSQDQMADFTEVLNINWGMWIDFNSIVVNSWPAMYFTAPPSGSVDVLIHAGLARNFAAGNNPNGNHVAVCFRVEGFGAWNEAKKNRFALVAYSTNRIRASSVAPVQGLTPGVGYQIVPQLYVDDTGGTFQIHYGNMTVKPVPGG